VPCAGGRTGLPQDHQYGRKSAAGVEALGSELISKLTYYERWIAAFAQHLISKNRFSRPNAPGAEDGRSCEAAFCASVRIRDLTLPANFAPDFDLAHDKPGRRTQ